jgi:3-phosphoshikimate 1-carboxyvinyltransferase
MLSVQRRENMDIYKLQTPQAKLHGEIIIPGSKSYTNRALILAALAEGESQLLSPSYSDDSALLISALQKLGVQVNQHEDKIVVHGLGGNFTPFNGDINVGAAGTSMRFLVSLCALAYGSTVILSGTERMHERPIEPLVNAWSALGVDIEYLQKEGCPPIKINASKKLNGGSVKLPGSISSQFFSSLLLVGGMLPNGLEIHVQGEQISRSYIDMTIDSMHAFGQQVENHDYKKYVVKGDRKPAACTYQVEGDVSGASYFWGLAAISGGQIRVNNVNPNSAQGDIRFPDILARMGCEVRSGYDGTRGWIEVQGVNELQGIEVDMTLMPDTAQTLAVVASVAKTPTRITGLGTLRIKETDRLLALNQELFKLDIQSEIGPDWIVIHPGQHKPARIKTYEDHRMAMSFAMLAGKISGVEIEHPEVVKKSFPDFWEKLAAVGVRHSLLL